MLRQILRHWAREGEDAVRDFKKGDQITAIVLSVDPERERISLGVKQALEDPFSAFIGGHSKGASVNGKVTSVDAKGAVVDLGDGVEGYLRATELSRDYVEDARSTGDESLKSRPMGRVIEPLSKMGADIESQDNRAPLIISGCSELQGIKYVLPVASAQVKSAVMLAGLYASGETLIVEPVASRDHTERMLDAFSRKSSRGSKGNIY